MQPLVLPVTIRHCAGMSEFFTSPLILVKNLHYVYSLNFKIQVESTPCFVKHRAIKTYEHWGTSAEITVSEPSDVAYS